MRLSRMHWIGLVVLTLCWGLSWPVMKIGVNHVPPLFFRALSFVIGLPLIFVAMRVRGIPVSLPEGTLKKVVLLSVPNVFLANGLMIIGLNLMPPGRSSLLFYTMPVWAAVTTALLMHVKLSGRAIFGVCAAAAGALLMLSGEFSDLGGNPLGAVLLLLAAASWGFGTVFLRKTPMPVHPMALTFWMVCISTAFFIVLSFVFERLPANLSYSHELCFAFVFNGLLVSAVAEIIWFAIARSLPPVASSLSVMLVPVLGVFSSAIVVGERPVLTDYAAMVLILIAMASVLVFSPGRRS